MARKELTPKEQIFCDKVLLGVTPTEAYRQAGYAPKAARVEGPRLLQRPACVQYLAEQRSKASERALSRRDKVLAELEKMAFVNIGDLITVDEQGHPQVDFSRATPDQLAAVSSISTKRRVSTRKERGGEEVEIEEQTAKFTLADKYRGLELLGKVEGMFAEPEVKVTVDVADRLLQARNRVLALTDQRGKQEDEETE